MSALTITYNGSYANYARTHDATHLWATEACYGVSAVPRRMVVSNLQVLWVSHCRLQRASVLYDATIFTVGAQTCRHVDMTTDAGSKLIALCPEFFFAGIRSDCDDDIRESSIGGSFCQTTHSWNNASRVGYDGLTTLSLSDAYPGPYQPGMRNELQTKSGQAKRL